jgi:hypothetical protein
MWMPIFCGNAARAARFRPCRLHRGGQAAAAKACGKAQLLQCTIRFT